MRSSRKGCVSSGSNPVSVECTKPVEDILTQLFGHSWYHRGQIAARVRELGGEPAATDFVFFTRELLSP